MAVLISDFFDRADQNPIGSPWTTAGPSSTGMQIISNQLWGGGGPSDPSVSIFTGQTFPDDQWAQCRVGTTNSATDDLGIGVLVRGSGSGATLNGYTALVNANNKLSIGKYVAGTYTSISVISTTVGNGDIIRLSATGTTLKAYVNAVQVGTNMTDASLSSGTPGVIRRNSSGNNIDDFHAGDFLGPTIISVSQITGTAGSGSTSVTVPADATAALLFWAGYNALGVSTLSTKTLAGSAFTTQSEIATKVPTASNTGTGVATLTTLPAAGSQTFAWAWSDTDARDEGGGMFIVWVKDVDTSSFVHDAKTDSETGGTLPAINVLAVATESVVVLLQSFSSIDAPSPANFLLSGIEVTINSEQYVLGEYGPDQSLTDCDITVISADYDTLAGISIRRAPAGGTPLMWLRAN